MVFERGSVKVAATWFHWLCRFSCCVCALRGVFLKFKRATLKDQSGHHQVGFWARFLSFTSDASGFCRGSRQAWTRGALVAALWITPPVEARVDTQSGGGKIPHLEGQSHSGTFVKSYSREELKQPGADLTNRELHERFIGEMTDLMNRIRNGLAGDAERRAIDGLKTQQPDAQRWSQSQLLLSGQVETKQADSRAIRSFFASQSQKAVTNSAKDRVPALNQLTSLKFDFDLRPNSRDLGPEQPSGRNLHYGLIIKHIEPDMGGAKSASTSTTPDEFAHAGRAHVQWGIGPLDEVEDRPIMPSDGASSSARRSIAGILIPSTKFKGSAQPENLVGGSQGKLPAWRFDLTQEDRLYNITYRTRTNSQVGNIEHSLNAPLFGSLVVSQRYSEKLSQVETSASGILLDQRLPQVIVRYLHIEERYRAEVQTQIKGHKIGAAARTKVHGKVDRPEDANEAFSVTFSKDF